MASPAALHHRFDAHNVPSILLPTRTSYAESLSSSSPGSSTSSASASSSHTSLSAGSPTSSSSTSKAPTPRLSAPTSARRIRFAPLPDPRREVLITDDGDELPIGPLPDLNSFPTSLLLPNTTSIVVKSPTVPKSALDACDPDPPALGAAHADDPTAYSSSSSSTHSYISSASSSASASAASTPRTATPSEYSPVSSVGSSPVTLTAALPAKNGDSISVAGPSSAPDPSFHPQNGYSASAAPTTSSSATSWPKPRSLSLLRRPFKKSSTSSSGSSSHSLTPTPSIETTTPNANGNGHAHTARKALSYSTEEILTLGTINLFRTSSRESNDSATTATTGWGLSRWSSAGSGNGKDSALFSGSPLARTQSTQSYKSRSKSIFGGLASGSTSSLSDSKSKSGSAATSASTTPRAAKPTPIANRHKGTRMLNGRVYGSKRAANANLFASARDEEPEFVEWGYGGMGSVKGAKSAGVGGTANGVNWARLQGGNGAAAPAAAEEEDDGSGMGWVKRRREERERKAREEKERLEKEKKEQEERVLNGDKEVAEPEQMEETAEKEKEATESKLSTPTPTRSSTMDGGFSALGSGATAAGEFASASASSAPVASAAALTSHSASGPTTPVPASDAPLAEAAPSASPFSALALGQNTHDEPGPIVAAPVAAEVKPPFVADEIAAADEEALHEMLSRSGVPTPSAALMNGFAFGGAELSATTPVQEHVPDVVPVPVRPRHHHHHHSHSRSHSRTVSLVSPTDEKTLEDAEALATVNELVVPIGEGEEEAPQSPLSSSSSESESESDADGERNDSNESNEDEEDGDEDEDEDEDEETDADLASKTMLGAGVEKVMRHKDKE